MLTLADSPSLARTRSPRPHAVVIGSGFGGLAAAVRLGARGYRVTVLERLDQPGGRARVHRQDGFTFDAGPTIVTAPSRMVTSNVGMPSTVRRAGCAVREGQRCGLPGLSTGGSPSRPPGRAILGR